MNSPPLSIRGSFPLPDAPHLAARSFVVLQRQFNPAGLDAIGFLDSMLLAFGEDSTLDSTLDYTLDSTSRQQRAVFENRGFVTAASSRRLRHGGFATAALSPSPRHELPTSARTDVEKYPSTAASRTVAFSLFCAAVVSSVTLSTTSRLISVYARGGRSSNSSRIRS